MKRERTYVAYSTENFELCGITILCIADTEALADVEGQKALPEGGDMRADTWRKNFGVSSQSRLKREIGKAAYETAVDRWIAKQEGKAL